MNHEQTLELVPLYALDALEGEELAQVSTHVETCEECSAELARHLSAATALVPDSPAPAHVWRRIEESLSSEPVPSVSVTRLTSSPSGPWRWVLGAAAVLALVFGGFVAGQNLNAGDLITSEGVVAAAEAASNQSGSFVADFFVDDVAVAQIVVTEDGLGYVIPTDELDALSPDRTYQLWVLTPDERAISAGVLGFDPHPATFTWSDAFAGFALTREVAGGVVSTEGDVVSVITEA